MNFKITRFYYSFAYLLLLGLPAFILTYVSREDIDLKAVAVVTTAVLVIGGIFDIWAVRQSKKDSFFIWEYNSRSILGFKLFGVPIEDFIFFLILTPIFIISMYEAIKSITFEGDTLSTITTITVMIMVISYFLVYKHAIRSKADHVRKN